MSAAFPARARFHAVNNCVSWSGRCAWKETNLEVQIIEYCKIGFSFVRARSSRAVRLATLLDRKSMLMFARVVLQSITLCTTLPKSIRPRGFCETFYRHCRLVRPMPDAAATVKSNFTISGCQSNRLFSQISKSVPGYKGHTTCLSRQMDCLERRQPSVSCWNALNT